MRLFCQKLLYNPSTCTIVILNKTNYMVRMDIPPLRHNFMHLSVMESYKFQCMHTKIRFAVQKV